MPKTIKIVPHLDSKELEDRYRKARDPVERSHYQILWLISQGKTTTEVMEVTPDTPEGMHPTTRWPLQRLWTTGPWGPSSPKPGRHRSGAAHRRAAGGARRGSEGAPARRRDVELLEGRRVDRGEDRQGGEQQEAEGLGVFEEAQTKPEGPKAPSRIGRQTRAGGFQKKLPMRVMRLKEAYPTAKVELSVVRGRVPPGPQADHPQGVESHSREAHREGPPALRVELLPLRLRAPENRRGLLVNTPHRRGGGVLLGAGELLRPGSGSGQEEKTHSCSSCSIKPGGTGPRRRRS